MTAWITVGLVGLGTLVLRGSFVAFLGDRELPETVSRGLRFVPSAVLTALVAPAVLMTEGAMDLAVSNLRIPAAVVAGLVAWRTRNIAYTILAGMVTLWLAQAIA